MPLSRSIGATILNTSVFGTLITFCSLLQILFAIFKSSYIAINDIFNISKNYISELNEIIDWILKDADIQYSFHIANKYNKLNEPIFIYGYSNVVDSELKNLQAEVLIDDEVISTIKLLYNPISGYYFTQFEPDTSGSYVFNFQNNKKLIDTINVNIYE